MTDSDLYTDAELLQRIANEDASAFRILFHRYSSKVYSVAKFITGSEFMGEEITQEVFLKLWLNRHSLTDIEHFGSYLKVVIRNASLNYLRQSANERIVMQKLKESSAGSEETTDITVELNEYQRLLAAAIERLPKQQKRVYCLANKEGLKQKEIAAIMNISLYTVKEYMKEAYKRINKILTSHFG